MSKRVLVLAANPKKDSFVNSLAETYASSAGENNEVRLLKISDMEFNMDLSGGYEQSSSMEDSLKSFQDSLEWCELLCGGGGYLQN